MSKVEERLAALGHKVPVPGAPIANFVNAVRTGNLVFTAGQGPRREDGQYEYVGKVGKDIDVETARKSAELVILNCLGAIKQEIGDLDKVKRVVKLLGMVNCTPDFKEHPAVINGCSELFAEVFGTEHGVGARSAVGMGSLPGNIAVEIEVIFEIT